MISSRCQLEISLSIISENYKALRAIYSGKSVGAAVKANAYGLGVKEVSLQLQQDGCSDFFVANIEEGIQLRQVLGQHGNIHVLHGVFSNEEEVFHQHNLTPVLNHLGQIEIWSKYAKKLSKKLPAVFHLNIGMNRLGITEQELIQIDQETVSSIDLKFVMGHLSSSEDKTNPINRQQLKEFNRLTSRFNNIPKSLCNSGGIFLGKEYHFDIARPGAAIYGINPTNEIQIKNPVRIYAPIIQLSVIEEGQSVGYGASYTNKEQKKIRTAIIPIGYADGIFRNLSNNMSFYINSTPVPILGRVSMDLTIIDVSVLPENSLFIGQKVEIAGDNCTPDAIAQTSTTITNEFLTGLGGRFDRIYSK